MGTLRVSAPGNDPVSPGEELPAQFQADSPTCSASKVVGHKDRESHTTAKSGYRQADVPVIFWPWGIKKERMVKCEEQNKREE